MTVANAAKTKAIVSIVSIASFCECTDVWVHIMSLLDPSDIFAIRKTCSALRNHSEQRCVWIEKATKVCSSHGLPLAFFSFPDMTRLDLEQLALAPAQFSDSVRAPIREDPKGRSPACTRTLHPRAQPGGDILHISSLRLLPGGRYLLTWTETIGMFLWDLGHDASHPPVEVPLAHLPSKARFDLDQATPTPDRCGVRIRCIGGPKSRHWHGQDLAVYEIQPASEVPKFQEINKWELPQECADKLAQSPQYIAVAQYMKGTITVYSIDAKSFTPQVIVPGGVSASMAIVKNILIVPTPGKMHSFFIANDKEPIPQMSAPRRQHLHPPRSDVLCSPDWVEGGEKNILCELHNNFWVTESQVTTGMVIWNVETSSEIDPLVHRGSTTEDWKVTGEKDQLVTIKHGNVLQHSPTHFFDVARKIIIVAEPEGDLERFAEDQIMVLKYPINVDPTLALHPSYSQWDWDSRFPRPDVLMLSHHGEHPEEKVSTEQFDVCCASGRLVVAPPVGFDAAQDKKANASKRCSNDDDGRYPRIRKGCEIRIVDFLDTFRTFEAKRN
ncbi:hypothetical protein BKA70DRAFT_1554255 [Coprinopsis sp. MPI-PUGE-AT-0042]|nr:hypothetical protein BKA70DRAFT_1554255 [Coprinopsis sp. MPI-PUGE-AT-0042]